MNASIKWIKRLKWILIIVLSMPIGYIINNVFGYSIWTWQYWTISLFLNFVINHYVMKYINYLYEERRKRKLNFKEYISDKKSGEHI